ncbi:hypothetical protein HDU98_004784, partial [Podochytrium sp. JEL0797]
MSYLERFPSLTAGLAGGLEGSAKASSSSSSSSASSSRRGSYSFVGQGSAAMPPRIASFGDNSNNNNNNNNASSLLDDDPFKGGLGFASVSSSYQVKGFGSRRFGGNQAAKDVWCDNTQEVNKPSLLSNEIKNVSQPTSDSSRPPTPAASDSNTQPLPVPRKGFTSFGRASSPSMAAASLKSTPIVASAVPLSLQSESPNSSQAPPVATPSYQRRGVYNSKADTHIISETSFLTSSEPVSMSSSPNTQRFNAFGGIKPTPIRDPADFTPYHFPPNESTSTSTTASFKPPQAPTPHASPSTFAMEPSLLISKLDTSSSTAASSAFSQNPLFAKLPSPIAANNEPSASILSSSFVHRPSFDWGATQSMSTSTWSSHSAAASGTSPKQNDPPPPQHQQPPPPPLQQQLSRTELYEMSQNLMSEHVSPPMRQFLHSIPRLMGLNHVLPIKLLQTYKLCFPLGEGATGFVAYATRVSDGLGVAIKCTFKDRLVPGGWKKDHVLGIVPMEVFIMKRLDHENIVRFYELYEDELFVYIVMEAVKNISFPTQQQQQQTPLTPIATTPITSTLTLSLSAANLHLLASPTLATTMAHLEYKANTPTSATGGNSSLHLPPAATTNLTSPTYGVPHAHDISSPSFPLLVKLNSKVNLTRLCLGESLLRGGSSSGAGSEEEDEEMGEGSSGVESLSDGSEEGGKRQAKFSIEDEESDEEVEGAAVPPAPISLKSEDGAGGVVVGSSSAVTTFGGRGRQPTREGVSLDSAAAAIGLGLSESIESITVSCSATGAGGSLMKRGKGSKGSYPILRVPKDSAAFAVDTDQPDAPYHAPLGSHHQKGFRKRAVSKDLFDYIEQKPKMGEGVAKLIFRQIAEAVRYLHGKGIVHRDIKDEN